jgi:hypothetical protein
LALINSDGLEGLFVRSGIVGARCFIDLEIINGENERKLEIIGGAMFVIDGDFVVGLMC